MHIVHECVGFHIHSKVTLLLDKVEQLINEIEGFILETSSIIIYICVVIHSNLL